MSLMRGQPDTPTPPHIVEAARKALRDGRTGYPDNQGEPALRRAVAEKLKREQGLAYDPDREILITDGATLGVCTALGALVERIATSSCPTRFMTPMRPDHALGWKARTDPNNDRDGRFTFNRQRLEEAWSTDTDLILLNTPWNPVGTVLNYEELVNIMEICREKRFPCHQR